MRPGSVPGAPARGSGPAPGAVWTPGPGPAAASASASAVRRRPTRSGGGDPDPSHPAAVVRLRALPDGPAAVGTRPQREQTRRQTAWDLGPDLDRPRGRARQRGHGEVLQGAVLARDPRGEARRRAVRRPHPARVVDHEGSRQPPARSAHGALRHDEIRPRHAPCAPIRRAPVPPPPARPPSPWPRPARPLPPMSAANHANARMSPTRLGSENRCPTVHPGRKAPKGLDGGRVMPRPTLRRAVRRAPRRARCPTGA